jgi:hypothetical protein
MKTSIEEFRLERNFIVIKLRALLEKWTKHAVIDHAAS